MKNLILILLVLFLLVSCVPKNDIKSQSVLKEEVLKTEKDFEKLVSEKGIAEGFYQFADAKAVIKREHDTLIIGNENIRNYYSNPKFTKVSVEWTPDFIEVSKDGEMAFTYGKYIWNVKDSLGKISSSTGIFHTVWKKQENGSWKYVWD